MNQGNTIRFAIAMSLAIVGTLCFMAGYRIPGIGCMMFSGLAWAVFGMSIRNESRPKRARNE